MNIKLDLVVPTVLNDVSNITENIDLLFSFLPIERIVVIGDPLVSQALPNNNKICFINENDIVDFSAVKEIMSSRIGIDAAEKRAGWYMQQFIKMGYSNICSSDYYLLWDSDTLPTKQTSFFIGDKPYFDCKTEYHKSYFDTMFRMFGDITRYKKGSFISEHMLIKTNRMKEMLSMIESNRTLAGSTFYEKIINSIEVKDLPASGFSEFETFGTYMFSFHKGEYGIRKWKSLRFGGFFFTRSISEKTIMWLSNYYDAISFEKKHYKSRLFSFVSTPSFQAVFSPCILNTFSFFIRAYRKFFFFKNKKS